MARLAFRSRAWREIDVHFEYLEEQGGREIADRFLDRLIESAIEPANMPNLGGLRVSAGQPCNARRWPVKDFVNWLIFYLPKRDGVEILRVIHGARDPNKIFNE